VEARVTNPIDLYGGCLCSTCLPGSETAVIKVPRLWLLFDHLVINYVADTLVFVGIPDVELSKQIGFVLRETA
jgi:hypothetical protein